MKYRIIRQIEKPLNYVLLSLCIAVAICVGVLVFPKQQVRSDLHTSAGTTTPPFGQFKTFTSQTLGISFVYAEGSGIQMVQVKQVGHRVYLYVDYTKAGDPTVGKFVEVFSKDPNQPLDQAVRQQFLQGYSPSTCKIGSVHFSQGKANPARQYVQITLPNNAYPDGQQELQAARQCPPTYTTSSLTGMSYFMSDPKHPSEFVYFKLGSDNFLAAPWTGNGVPLTWDRSLVFLDH